MIMIRTLRRDIARYNKEDELVSEKADLFLECETITKTIIKD